MRQLVYNAVRCRDCDETIVSYHRHDYKTCSCGNAMVDGGTAYTRYGGKDIEKVDIYADDDFEVVRRYATRGTSGPNGEKPFTWIALCDMTDEHLEGVLDYGGADWHLELIRKEIEYRKV